MFIFFNHVGNNQTIETVHAKYTRLPHCVVNPHVHSSGEIFSILHSQDMSKQPHTFLPWLNISSTKGKMWTSIVLLPIPLRHFGYPISTCVCLCIFILNYSSFLGHWEPLICQLTDYWAHKQLTNIWLLYWPFWPLYYLFHLMSRA